MCPARAGEASSWAEPLGAQGGCSSPAPYCSPCRKHCNTARQLLTQTAGLCRVLDSLSACTSTGIVVYCDSAAFGKEARGVRMLMHLEQEGGWRAQAPSGTGCPHLFLLRVGGRP